MNIALGSSFEFETQLLISFNLKYISDENYEFVYKNLKHIQNMLIKLIDNYK
ncbi:four helix bundle protein [Elizabethkingia ursingii]